MTQVHEWGPHIWKLLHYHAEYAGASVLLADEIRAWMAVLKTTEGVLACATCREHYRTWRQHHPTEEFIGKDKETFRELLRRWLWDLHESVNQDKGVPPERRIPFDELKRYREIPRYEIIQSMSTLKDIFQTAILHRQLNPLAVKEWLRIFTFLQKLIG